MDIDEAKEILYNRLAILGYNNQFATEKAINTVLNELDKYQEEHEILLKEIETLKNNMPLISTLILAKEGTISTLNILNYYIEILNKGTKRDTANGEWDEFVIKLYTL